MNQNNQKVVWSVVVCIRFTCSQWETVTVCHGELSMATALASLVASGWDIHNLCLSVLQIVLGREAGRTEMLCVACPCQWCCVCLTQGTSLTQKHHLGNVHLLFEQSLKLCFSRLGRWGTGCFQKATFFCFNPVWRFNLCLSQKRQMKKKIKMFSLPNKAYYCKPKCFGS